MSEKRQVHEPPEAVGKWGWRYHHMGVPTVVPRQGECYLERYKMYVSGYGESPFGIEWMRFEKDSPVSKLIQKVPHIAFEVDDLEEALKGKEVLGEVASPSDGVTAVMIVDNGAPVELLEFDSKK